MRKYRYEASAFARSVTFTGIFCLLVALYSLFMLLQGNYLFWLFLLVGLYQFFNTFITVSNPQEVVLEEDAISFSAYGKTHRYLLSEITSLRVKELEQHKKLYLRVNEGSLTRGRYWIVCKNMNDGRELWDYLAWLEYQKEPNQLKFQSRIPKDPFAPPLDTQAQSANTDLTIEKDL